MTEAQVLSLIQSIIIANGNNEITANVLRPVLEEMLVQANILIGDLGDLQTTANENLVEAINEVLGETGSSITILTGTTDPNIFAPPVVDIGDFYVWDDGTLKGFFQYNGVDFVLIKNLDIENDLISADVGNQLTLGSDDKMFVNSSSSIPIENVYPDIFTASTGLLDNQLDQTTGFIQKVLDASADPNITIPSGESTVRYYEKLAASTAVLANYDLLNAQQTAVINADVAFNQFSVDTIQLGDLSGVSSGEVKLKYENVDNTLVEIGFASDFSGYISSLAESTTASDFTASIKIYNKSTGKFLGKKAITFDNYDAGNYSVITLGGGIPVSDFSVTDVLLIDFSIYAIAGTGDMTKAVYDPTNRNSTVFPVTTKGDIYTFNTDNARLPVGANGLVLTADSTEPTGIKWTSVSEEDVIGSALIDLTATGTVSALNFVTKVHGYYNLTGAMTLTVTEPTLAIGETVTRTIEIKANTFDTTLPTEITDSMVGTYDASKRNFIAITYCRIDGSTVIRFANLSVI